VVLCFVVLSNGFLCTGYICASSCVLFTLCCVLLKCAYCCVYLVAGPLDRCQCPEGPATDHLDTGFLSWFPCVLKQMLRWFPNIQDVSTCFSCSPPM